MLYVTYVLLKRFHKFGTISTPFYVTQLHNEYLTGAKFNDKQQQ